MDYVAKTDFYKNLDNIIALAHIIAPPWKTALPGYEIAASIS